MQKQLAEFIFAKGLASQTDAKIVAPGSLLALENGRFRKAGAIEKRFGQQPLVRNIFGTTSRILSALAIARLGDELLLADAAGELYSYAPALKSWIDKGAVSPVALRSKPLLRNTYQQSNPDSATRNGVTVHAWADTRGGVYADVVDQASGTKILADENLSATGVRPRVVAVDTSILVVYQEAGEVKCRAVRVAKPTEFATAELLATDAAVVFENQHLDVCPSGIPEAAFFAYNTGTGASIKVGYIRRDGSVGDPGNGGYPNLATIAEAAPLAIAIALDPSNGSVFLFYSTGSAIRTAALYNDFTVRNAPSLVETLAFVMNVAPALVGDAWTVFYEVFATKSYNRLVKIAAVSMAGVASGTAVLQRAAGLASKAFVREGRAHAAIVHDSSPSDVPDPSVPPAEPMAFLTLHPWYRVELGHVWQDSAGTVPAVLDNDPVARLDDQSGNGLHLVTTDVSARPLLKLNAQNGKPGLLFDGINDVIAAIGTPAIGSAFVVANYTAAATFADYDGCLTDLSGSNGDILFIGTGTTNDWYNAGRFGTDIYVDGAHTVDLATLADAHASVGIATVITNAVTQLQIGHDRGTGGGRFWKGLIFEAGVVPTAISAGDRDDLLAYFQYYWGTP